MSRSLEFSPFKPWTWFVIRWDRVPTVVSLMSLKRRENRDQNLSLLGTVPWDLSSLEPFEHGRGMMGSSTPRIHAMCLTRSLGSGTGNAAGSVGRARTAPPHLSRCSTPTSSASSAPISLVTCSKVLEVGVPS